MLLTLCVSGLNGGTHTGQQLTRKSCFPSPLPRPAHHYFVWTQAACHMCITLSGCFISTIAAAALCAQTVRHLWLNAPVTQGGVGICDRHHQMRINCVQAWDNVFFFFFYSGCLISLTNSRHADSNSRFDKLVRPDIRPKNLNTQGSISSHCGSIATQLTWNVNNNKRADWKINSTVLPYRQIGGTLVCVKSTFFFYNETGWSG